MNDSEEHAAPGKESRKTETDRIDVIKEGLTSLSDWAEFSSLIRKLDEEYAETLSAPQQHRAEDPKPTGS